MKLDKSYKDFPNANGFFVIFSNKEGIGERTIDNVHNTSDNLCHSFGRQGLACCQFKDCEKAEIKAAYKELAAMVLPKFKSVIIYHIGHGENSYINVRDGFLSILTLKSIISEQNAPNLKGKAKVLIIDCCRCGILAHNQTYNDILVVYTTALGKISFVFTARGMSIASEKLVELLERDVHCSLNDLLVVDLSEAVRKAAALSDDDDLNLKINCEGGLSRTVHLNEDRLKCSKLQINCYSLFRHCLLVS